MANREVAMPYETIPTTENPAYIIFVIEINKSLKTRIGKHSRLRLIHRLLDISLAQMMFRIPGGQEGLSAYRVAIITAGDKAKGLFDGFLPADDILKRGIPQFDPSGSNTDAVGAFHRTIELLQKELPKIQNSPAPIVVHLPAGKPTGAIEPMAKRIMSMRVPDGNVLIENIYVGNSISDEPIADPFQWSGVLLFNKDSSSGNFLNASSGIPNSYCSTMRHAGFNLDTWALMTVPGHVLDLLELGFYLALSGPWSRLNGAMDSQKIQEMTRADFKHFQDNFNKVMTA
jgi:hypothetical protein